MRKLLIAATALSLFAFPAMAQHYGGHGGGPGVGGHGRGSSYGGHGYRGYGHGHSGGAFGGYGLLGSPYTTQQDCGYDVYGRYVCYAPQQYYQPGVQLDLGW